MAATPAAGLGRIAVRECIRVADINDPPQTADGPPQAPAPDAPPPHAPPPDATIFAPAPKRAGEGSLPIGTLLNHIYKVNRFIARGGMAEVYEGENVTTGERVAIKIILGHLKADEAMQGLFLREARTLTRLNHAALVLYRVLAREPDLGVLYIVTEFVDGVPLEKLIGSRVITETEQRGLLRRLAEGLKTAHDLGAIHRDISPDNIMAPEGRLDQAKIIDFGIAKDLMASQGTLIGDGFAGKLGFVAPEQFGDFGREVGPWTDVYSLGLVMLAVANGAPVDMGATLVDAMDRRRAGPDLSKAPESLKPVLSAMLVADPKQRLRSMDEVLAMLNATGLTAPPPNVGARPSPGEPAVVVAAQPAEDPTLAAAAQEAADRERHQAALLTSLSAAEAAYQATRGREAEAAAAAETASNALSQAASQLRGVVDMGAGGTVVQAARQDLAQAAEAKSAADAALQAAREQLADAAEALSAARAAAGVSDRPPAQSDAAVTAAAAAAAMTAPPAQATAPPIQAATAPPPPLAQPQPLLQPQGQPPGQQLTPAKKGGGGAVFAIVALVLVVLLVGSGYYAWTNLKALAASPAAQTAQAPAAPAAQAPATPAAQTPAGAAPGDTAAQDATPAPDAGTASDGGAKVAQNDTAPPAAGGAVGANLTGSWASAAIGCGMPNMYVRIRVDGDQMAVTIAGENERGRILGGDADSARVDDGEGVTRFRRSGDSMVMSDANGQTLNLVRCGN